MSNLLLLVGTICLMATGGDPNRSPSDNPTPGRDQAMRVEAVTANASAPAESESRTPQLAGPQFTLKAEVDDDGLVRVDVFLDNVLSLRGYQVELRACGGDVGSLELVEVRVDREQKNFAFKDLTSFGATDLTGSRLAEAMLEGGVEVDKPVYLGTFVFKASEDAKGTFAIALQPDPKTLLRDAEAQAIEFTSLAVSSLRVAGPGKDTR